MNTTDTGTSTASSGVSSTASSGAPTVRRGEAYLTRPLTREELRRLTPKQRNARHLAQRKAQQRRWYHRNAEAQQARARTYYAGHQEEILVRQKARKDALRAHREEVLTKRAAMRATKKATATSVNVVAAPLTARAAPSAASSEANKVPPPSSRATSKASRAQSVPFRWPKAR